MTTSGVGPVPAPDFRMSRGGLPGPGQRKIMSADVGTRVTAAHTGQ
ncbi:hypothetical protein BCL76_11239 [Streptomyces sp. CG 926]|nr:hypothetical protein BCL76_11239 [Streptomyces sp. CG 926]